MEKVTYRFTLDTHKNGIQRTLQGFQIGDNMSRQLEISLKENGEPYDIPLDGVVAVMYSKRPSQSNPSINSCTIENNKIRYEVPSTDLTEEGMVQYQLKLISGTIEQTESVLISSKFEAEVWESEAQDSSAEDTPTYTALEEALIKAQAVYNSRITSFMFNYDIPDYSGDHPYELTVVYGYDDEEEVQITYVTDVFEAATQAITEELAQRFDISGKMDKNNPTGTGSFSLNRKSGYTVGDYSVATGYNTKATGLFSNAENLEASASGQSSHAEGYYTTAGGENSHAEGDQTLAHGVSSHAEGVLTKSNGTASHAEGFKTVASGNQSHAEGDRTTASGTYASHAEGSNTTASGNYSHAEGNGTAAYGIYSHAEGCGFVSSEVTPSTTITVGSVPQYGVSVNCTLSEENSAFQVGKFIIEGDKYYLITAVNGTSITLKFAYGRGPAEGVLENYTLATVKGVAFDSAAHVEGSNNKALGYGSHAEGDSTTANGSYSHTEGYATMASGMNAHAEGEQTEASGNDSHAEGHNTKALGYAAHAEGDDNEASGDYSHAEGCRTSATGMYSHAEGCHTGASGYASHAEGNYNVASGSYAHVEGGFSRATANCAHAEGSGTTAGGENSHAEGSGTEASGEDSHAEGSGTTAGGENSHAEGSGTTASGRGSHSQNRGTIASGTNQTAIGKYNTPISDVAGGAALIIGNGTSDNDRSNALEVDWEGNLKAYGEIVDGDGIELSTRMAKQNPHGTGNMSMNRLEGSTVGPRSATFNGGFETRTISSDSPHLHFLSEDANHLVTFNCVGSNRVTPATKQILHFDDGTDTHALPIVSETWDNDNMVYLLVLDNSEDLDAFSSSLDYVCTSTDIWYDNVASGEASVAFGKSNTASGYNSAAFGLGNTVSASQGAAFGTGNKVHGANNVAVGVINELTATSGFSFAVGSGNTVTANSAFVGGNHSEAKANCAFAQGDTCTASGTNSFAIGYHTSATKNQSVAMGNYCTASQNNAVALGNYTTASGYHSFAEGERGTASGTGSHKEGSYSTASGNYSHAEGMSCIASGEASHAQGNHSEAKKSNAFASGYYVTADSANQTALGRFNVIDNADTYALIVGNGANASNRSNALTVGWDGSVTASGDVTDGSGNKLSDKSEKFAVISYGQTTWAEFLELYNNNAIVFCRASSSPDPSTGTQSRLAFMAYIAPTNPTEVEFQYYRTIGNAGHTYQQQVDEVFIYKLNSAGVWSVGHRYTGPNVKAGTGLTYDWVDTGNYGRDLKLNIDPAVLDAKMDIPTLPTTDGTYTLQVTISNGTPTYSWV